MQITCFKRLFVTWNKPFESVNFCASDQLDLIDWEAVVVKDCSFDDNLHFLKNNYPQYFWSHFEKEQEGEELDLKFEQKKQAEEARVQHEALHEAEIQQEVPVPEDLEEPETPTGKWKIEQSDGVETRTIELEVLPHRIESKGKPYEYGRIQLIVDKNLVGCPVKVSIKVLKI